MMTYPGMDKGGPIDDNPNPDADRTRLRVILLLGLGLSIALLIGGLHWILYSGEVMDLILGAICLALGAPIPAWCAWRAFRWVRGMYWLRTDRCFHCGYSLRGFRRGV